MIPPVVLNASEGQSILDMCAAPGSKTCQLLEVAGALPTPPSGAAAGSAVECEPAGFVVANDADPKRAYMLVCQLRRMNSPAVFVTSCDGQHFPILDDKAARGTDREGMFDRVLADVPCSGETEQSHAPHENVASRVRRLKLCPSPRVRSTIHQKRGRHHSQESRHMETVEPARIAGAAPAPVVDRPARRAPDARRGLPGVLDLLHEPDGERERRGGTLTRD